MQRVKCIFVPIHAHCKQKYRKIMQLLPVIYSTYALARCPATSLTWPDPRRGDLIERQKRLAILRAQRCRPGVR